MTGSVLDQQLVIHLYAPTDGPDAPAAYRALRELWQGCRQVFRIHDPIPGTGLPPHLPDSYTELPATAATGSEAALAAQEQSGSDCQAVLRRHHGLLNLSVALAPSEAAAPLVTERAWKDLDTHWDALTVGRTVPLLGEARIYLAKIGGAGLDDTLATERPLVRRLTDRLPPAAQAQGWWHRLVTYEQQVALWETSPLTDDRALRRLVVAFAGDADVKASAWVWSQGDPAIPPLARYLLHAAVIRYHLRVWERDNQTRELRGTLDALITELQRRREESFPADDVPQTDLLQLRRFDALLRETDLRELRRAVEISADNLARAVGAPELLAPGGPFADDRDLARSFLVSLDDELAYLDIIAERAARAAIMPSLHEPDPSPGRPPPAAGPDAEDVARRVFVIHGRDMKARNALFDFLHRIDLLPMEWEMLVADAGVSSPYLGDVVAQAVTRARACVALLTPDDVVHLHSSLRKPREDAAELGPAMQARPNVLMELGMSLATYPESTVILVAGSHRPITDLGGLNYIQLDDSAECRRKIATRLRLAGCRVNEGGEDWLRPGLFARLRAYNRQPDSAHGPI